MSLTNPLTGRQIQYGGRTHRKLLKMSQTIDEILLEDDMQTYAALQRGGAADGSGSEGHKGKVAQKAAREEKNFYDMLLRKSQQLDIPTPINSKSLSPDKEINIPKSKYHLISSALPPNPEQHSWYHHHAPFSQNFGDYVCIKRSTLKDLGIFLRDSLGSDIRT